MRAQVDHHEARRGLAGAGRARRGPARLVAAVALALVSGPGCGPDSAGKYAEFLDETKDERDMPAPKEDFATIEGDISGDFLLAVSASFAEDTPLQFIATSSVTVDADGKQLRAVTLQPLSLEQGEVLKPRQPVGDPLVFEGLPIVDGRFTIDAGTVMVTGEANPITGSDIIATLLLTGSIMGEDLYCGTVAGEVTSPLMLPLEGSTFAAVRLQDKTMLPTDVLVDCDGSTKPPGPP